MFNAVDFQTTDNVERLTTLNFKLTYSIQKYSSPIMAPLLKSIGWGRRGRRVKGEWRRGTGKGKVHGEGGVQGEGGRCKRQEKGEEKR